MKRATFKEYEEAKLEIIRGKEYKEDANMDEYGINRKTYFCEDGSTFWEVTENGITEFWSTVHSESRKYEQPEYKPVHEEKEELSESCQKAIKRIHKLVYWFADEMFKEEDRGKQIEAEFKRRCEAEPDKQIFIVNASENNVRVMKDCLRSARDAAEFLKNKDNDIEEWQLAAINAMFDKCNEERIVPYNLPEVIKGLLCMHILCKAD